MTFPSWSRNLERRNEAAVEKEGLPFHSVLNMVDICNIVDVIS